MTYTIIAGAKAAGATIAPILENIVALASNGLIVRTSSTTVAARTLTGTPNRISITNGDGVAGDPTFDIGSDVVTLTGTQTLTNKTLTSPVINTPNLTGGTINNASVGATTPSTGAFTTISASSNITMQDATRVGRSDTNPALWFSGDQANIARGNNSSILSRFNAGTQSSIASVLFTNGAALNTNAVPNGLGLSSPYISFSDRWSIGLSTGSTLRIGYSNSLATVGVLLSLDQANWRLGVGKNNVSPATTLHVALNDENTGSVQYPLRVDHTTTGTPASGIGTGIDLQAQYSGSTIGSIAQIDALTTALSQTGALVFKTANGGAPAERMRITSAGRLGIGLTNPNNLLDVAGTAQVDGLRIDQTPTAETITPTHTITISVDGTLYKLPLQLA